MFEQIWLKNILDVFIRTVIIFFITFIALRVRGKKQLAQLTLFDILMVIALGSAVGDVMIYPEESVSLFRSIVAIISLVLLIHTTEYVASRVPSRFAKIIYDESLELVRDGKLLKKNFEKSNLSEEQFRSMLREKNIQFYSEARLVILEPDGELSVQRIQNRKKNTFSKLKKSFSIKK
jgi:uncharacterized membrane protein YcaP (DUF421 family)